MSAEPIVIVGAGHAAVQLCASLIEAGQGHRILLIGAESELPYQRPPLSKSFLKKADEPTQLLREASWFERAGLQLILGQAVVALDRQAKTIGLADGRSLSYGQLVLATGTRARTPSAWPVDATNVHVLRSAQDARVLRQALAACSAVTVLGGGFIGLEVAATCAGLGKPVRVLEAGPRLMGRAVSAALSEHVLQAHRTAGMSIELQASARPEFHADRLTHLTTDAGRHEVDLLLLAIGGAAGVRIGAGGGSALRRWHRGGRAVAYQRRPHLGHWRLRPLSLGAGTSATGVDPERPGPGPTGRWYFAQGPGRLISAHALVLVRTRWAAATDGGLARQRPGGDGQT